MKGLKKFLSIENKSYCKANKEELKQDLKLESYRADSII